MGALFLCPSAVLGLIHDDSEFRIFGFRFAMNLSSCPRMGCYTTKMGPQTSSLGAIVLVNLEMSMIMPPHGAPISYNSTVNSYEKCKFSR